MVIRRLADEPYTKSNIITTAAVMVSAAEPSPLVKHPARQGSLFKWNSVSVNSEQGVS